MTGALPAPRRRRILRGMRLRAAAIRRSILLLAACGLPGACAPAPPAEAPSPALDAPWAGEPLAASSVPAVYLEEWRAAGNRARCAPMAPALLDPALAREATPRAATFSGGWGIAYDLPATRSAFGVAGTGASAWSAEVYDDWPYRRRFRDGSSVGYGPEGGAGPNWLAYIRVPGQECLYNVWSRRGREHLEELLGQLRFVRAR